MRLVCPNCEAKYEVPEDAIPETGRDVQCANCGHAWYQMRSRPAAPETAAPVPASVSSVPSMAEAAPAAAPVAAAVVPEEGPAQPVAPVPEPEVAALAVEETPEVAEAEPDVVEPSEASGPTSETADVAPVVAAAVDPVPGSDPEPQPEPASEPEPQPEIEQVGLTSAAAETAPAEVEIAAAPTHLEDEGAPEAPAAVAATAAAAYAVDDSVLAILREEAEREAQARKAEAAKPLETQTELGIEQAVPEVNLPHQPVFEDVGLAARRARLPDVEEINSTLRPVETAADNVTSAGDQGATEGRSSFRSGFLMVMTVAILGAAVYGSADAIADVVPALAGVLKSYVAFVDSLRLQLDGLMQSATVALNGT